MMQLVRWMLTVLLGFFMAIIAAMKKVLSPISETRIINHDFTNPCTRPDVGY